MEVSRIKIICDSIRILNQVKSIPLDDYYNEMQKCFLEIYQERLTEEDASFVYDQLTQTLFKMVKFGLIRAVLTSDMEPKLTISQEPQKKILVEKIFELEQLLEIEVLEKELHDFEPL